MYVAAQERSPLRMAVQAASLAGYGSYFRATQLSAQAQEVYGSALNALNSHLTDSRLAVQDDTLAAALTLVMFEVRRHHLIGPSPACQGDGSLTLVV